MTDMKELVKVAVDAYHGNVQKYSDGQASELLREALVEANGGSTRLDYRAVRDGKCNGMFALVEQILNNTVVEGLTRDMYFNSLVDFRNVAEGDQNLFVTEDNTLFTVSEVADGTQAIRRQRISGVAETPIPTSMKMVRIYDELNRVLSGRVDFNQMIAKVADSFEQKILTDIYTIWTSITSSMVGGTTYYPAAGAYDEDTLLELIAHVEAAAGGKQATIIGTAAAIRNLQESIQSDSAKEELHNLGYYGKFYGTPVVKMPQRHKVGTNDFVLDDKILSIVATDAKPIKFVYEGDPIVIMGNPLDRMDLTQEYLYGVKYGVGFVMPSNSGMGIYNMHTD